MKNRYKLSSRFGAFFALFALMCNSLVAQIFQVGTGTIQNTTTSYPAPYGNFYWGAKHQFLVTAAELQAAGASNGDINSIGFDVVTPAGIPLVDFEIKIGTTATTDLTTWEAGLTSVFSHPSILRLQVLTPTILPAPLLGMV